MLRRTQTRAPSAVDRNKWFDDDFAGVKIKNFDEMRENFIEDLTNQFSDLLLPTNARPQSMKIQSNLPTLEGNG